MNTETFPTNTDDARVPTKTKACFMGGCGCVLLFAAFVILALIIPGGRVDVQGDPILAFTCVFLFLFVVGGILGLLIRWIYKKGYDASKK